jgi:hypothetical protein
LPISLEMVHYTTRVISHVLLFFVIISANTLCTVQWISCHCMCPYRHFCFTCLGLYLYSRDVSETSFVLFQCIFLYCHRYIRFHVLGSHLHIYSDMRQYWLVIPVFVLVSLYRLRHGHKRSDYLDLKLAFPLTGYRLYYCTGYMASVRVYIGSGTFHMLDSHLYIHWDVSSIVLHVISWIIHSLAVCVVCLIITCGTYWRRHWWLSLIFSHLLTWFVGYFEVIVHLHYLLCII